MISKSWIVRVLLLWSLLSSAAVACGERELDGAVAFSVDGAEDPRVELQVDAFKLMTERPSSMWIIIKATFFYCCIVFLLNMSFMSRKVFRIRGRIYFCLCMTVVLEIGLTMLGANDFNEQFWVLSKLSLNLTRLVFLSIAAGQILYSIFTYRDDRKFFLDLILSELAQHVKDEMMREMNKFGERMLSDSMEESDGSMEESEMSMEESERSLMNNQDNLTDGVDRKMDPNNTLLLEDASENIIKTPASARYNLRPRNRQ